MGWFIIDGLYYLNLFDDIKTYIKTILETLSHYWANYYRNISNVNPGLINPEAV
jgi:hypothetical protein